MPKMSSKKVLSYSFDSPNNLAIVICDNTGSNSTKRYVVFARSSSDENLANKVDSIVDKCSMTLIDVDSPKDIRKKIDELVSDFKPDSVYFMCQRLFH
jgi:hypothetical protein